MKLATVINFCTNELPFLRCCVENALQVSQQVIVSVCERFFDGTPENGERLRHACMSNPECEFLLFAFDSERNFYTRHGVRYWHNWGRLLGYFHLHSEIEAVLFLDSDEILDVEAFKSVSWEGLDAARLANYWYFREPIYRAKTLEDSPLFVKRNQFSPEKIMDSEERAGTYARIEGNKQRYLLSKEGYPLIHHYSWVRSKEAMLRKVRSWGHREERPWEKLVEEEFSRPFSGKDFVHGYEFEKVPPQFTFHDGIPLTLKEPKNVRFISTDEMHRIDLNTFYS
jgi:hypothetical protein